MSLQPAIAEAAPSTAFSRLLAQLAQEHDRKLQEVQAIVESLQIENHDLRQRTQDVEIVLADDSSSEVPWPPDAPPTSPLQRRDLAEDSTDEEVALPPSPPPKMPPLHCHFVDEKPPDEVSAIETQRLDSLLPKAMPPPAPLQPHLEEVEGHQLRVSWIIPETTPPVTNTAVQIRQAGQAWQLLDTTGGDHVLVHAGGQSVRAPTCTVVLAARTLQDQPRHSKLAYEAVVTMKSSAGWSAVSPISNAVRMKQHVEMQEHAHHHKKHKVRKSHSSSSAVSKSEDEAPEHFRARLPEAAAPSHYSEFDDPKPGDEDLSDGSDNDDDWPREEPVKKHKSWEKKHSYAGLGRVSMLPQGPKHSTNSKKTCQLSLAEPEVLEITGGSSECLSGIHEDEGIEDADKPEDDDAALRTSQESRKNKDRHSTASVASSSSYLPGVPPGSEIDSESDSSEDSVDVKNTHSHNEAHTFSVTKVWAAYKHVASTAGTVRHSEASATFAKTAASFSNLEDAHYEPHRWFIAHPSSPRRFVWDILGVALIAYDIIMIPMALFELPEGDFLLAMNWTTLIFWTGDVFASFMVGYVEKGETIMSFPLIAKHYMKTWLFPDLLIVGADWSYSLSTLSGDQSGGGVGDFGRFARVMRSVRTLRLLRLLKIKRILNEIHDRIDSEYFSILGDVVKLLLTMLILSHIIACVWYAIGNAGRNGNMDNWSEEAKLDNEPLELRYVTSLHWSLTQLMLESMDVEATNIYERWFTIATLNFGLLVFSSVISRITNSMMQLSKMSHNTSQQFWLLRRYFREWAVPKSIATRVCRYLEYACQKHEKGVQESSVKILRLLSNQLRDELQYAIVVPQLSTHLLFERIGKVSDVTMHRLSRQAVLRVALACKDSAFFKSETATHMYYIISGAVVYIHSQQGTAEASKGDWICEPALWTPWVHLGDMHATVECDLIAIDSLSFGETMRANPLTYTLGTQFAVRYVEALNQLPHREVSDLAMFGDGREIYTHLVHSSGSMSNKPSVHSGESDEQFIDMRKSFAGSIRKRLSTLLKGTIRSTIHTPGGSLRPSHVDDHRPRTSVAPAYDDISGDRADRDCRKTDRNRTSVAPAHVDSDGSNNVADCSRVTGQIPKSRDSNKSTDSNGRFKAAINF